MRRLLACAIICLCLIPALVTDGESIEFERYFTDKGLRVDLFHAGTATTESFSLDELIEQPYWGGNPGSLIDTLNLGGYLVRVLDLATNDQIYSRGYCTLFGEWVTTDEAIAEFPRTFHESVIIPYPLRPAQVRIDRRDRSGVFRNVYDLVIDPDDYHIRKEKRCHHFKVRSLLESGPPERKVDLVILGDGYRKDEMHKLRGDTERFLEALFTTEPFASRKGDFNVKLVESLSLDSGVDEPRKGIYRNNALGLSFNTFDLERYMLSFYNKPIRDAASRAPYDLVVIIANTQRYGGGGIFNLYSISCSDNEYDEYVFVHELGHALAGLADEYYSSDVAYNDMYPRGIEPWEKNITALLDTTEVKWGDLIDEGTPVPTPPDSVYAGVVGCFEGAGYSAKGLYRSSLDCRMFSKSLVDFCPVCRRAIEEVIDFHAR
jgi:hypothetical protein